MSNTRMWDVGITIVMPAHAVIIEAPTEAVAIARALHMLNEAGEIPEHGTCDVHAEEGR